MDAGCIKVRDKDNSDVIKLSILGPVRAKYRLIITRRLCRSTVCVCLLAVVGCADMAVPDSALVERKADLLTVRCHASQETWYLTCKNRRWVGTMANCSNGTIPLVLAHFT